MASNCHYLGWKNPFLDSAVDWILENRRSSLGELTLALPGKRAARGLEERLALKAEAGDGVPRLVSIGQLSDLLIESELPRASDMTRLLAWAEALQGLKAKEIQFFVKTPPAPDDLPSWLILAQILRTLHGELAAEMLDFGDVLKNGNLPTSNEERRWEVLQKLQKVYRATLEELGVSDPHEARAKSIRAERVSIGGEILLVGITDINKLQRSALELVQSQVTPLVFAPSEHERMFDELGCVQVEAWSNPEFQIPIQHEDWSIANMPQDQAELVIQSLSKWNGEYSADEISVAVLDDKVQPFLEQAFHSQGVETHQAEGTPIQQTSPWRLLDALASWLDGRLERNLAPLLRHPEFCSAFSCSKAIGELDTYHNDHFPYSFGKKLLGHPEKFKDLKPIIASIDSSLKLTEKQIGATRTPEEWIPCIQSFLETVWGGKKLNEDVPKDNQTIGAIRVLSRAMESFLDVPLKLRSLLAQSLPGTIRLLLHQAGGESIPKKNPNSFVEMVGWLEIRMDPAKAVVVCGFNEGKVPESKHADIFLPNMLRETLNLPGNKARYARDAYALSALSGGNRRFHLVSGRQSVDGDRYRPSRLLFHCNPAEIPERLNRFLEEDGSSTFHENRVKTSEFELPRRKVLPELSSMRVTDFSAFLRSPYEYYLARRLNLKTIDDEAQELGPLQFGSLVHDVLEDFGNLEDYRSCPEANLISDELDRILDRRSASQFGNDPLPAVRLQIEVARKRLAVFSQTQAKRVLAGWRQVEVELGTPDGGIEIDLNGTPIRLRGKIDRIDQHQESGKCQIIDFKTGEGKMANPYKNTAGHWVDLQLPLYRLIAKKLGNYGEKPDVAYWPLPRLEDDASLLELGFDDETPWETATEQAAHIVKTIQSELDEDGGWAFASGGESMTNPILAGIAGQGLLLSDAEEEEKKEEPR